MIEILLALIVAVTGISRTVDPGLTAIAEQRAVEVSTDATWSHDLMRAGTWEVLVWNSGYADPVTTAVSQWQGSPTHWMILTNPALTRIGCGHAVGQEGRDVFACVLLPPSEPTAQVAPEATPWSPPRGEAPVVMLPNTAMVKP